MIWSRSPTRGSRRIVTNLRRGFKSESNQIARAVRRELRLRPTDPIDPWTLADYLGIPLVALSAFHREAAPAVKHFSVVEPSAFSAMTVFFGSKRLIVYNDSHSRGRQSSDITHETAHALLLHPPAPALSAYGCRTWEATFEGEANWLAGALLVSEEAALEVARSGMSVEVAAKAYGTSQDMIQWRLNVTAARRRAESTQWGSSDRRRERDAQA